MGLNVCSDVATYIERYHDDASTIMVDVYDDEEEPVSLVTASGLEFSVRSRSTEEVILTKQIGSGVSVDPVYTNRMLVEILKTDFVDKSGTHDWRARVEFLGNPSTVVSGTWEIKPF